MEMAAGAKAVDCPAAPAIPPVWDAIRRVTEVAAKLGVPMLSLFAFSRENWSRAPEEVSHLFQLLEFYLAKETANLVRNGIRLRVIGWRDPLAHSVCRAIEAAELATQEGTRMQLVIAVNFSGRWELTQMVENIRKLARTEPITEELIRANMPYPEIPAPDLFIRTAGEKRISNYFLWNLAYTELHFTDVCWPDFSEQDFREALALFAKRNRSFGAVPSVQASNIGNGCPLSSPPRTSVPGPAVQVRASSMGVPRLRRRLLVV